MGRLVPGEDAAADRRPDVGVAERVLASQETGISSTNAAPIADPFPGTPESLTAYLKAGHPKMGRGVQAREVEPQ